MKKLGLLLFALCAVKTAYAQEFIYDNLPAGQSSNEISFLGKWCSIKTSGYFGTKSLQSCGTTIISEYLYSPILANGIYDVFIRWIPSRKYSKTAAVSITSTDYYIDNISGAVSTVYSNFDYSVNQTIKSNGWYYIGRFTSVGGVGAVAVHIANTAGMVNTDGVRLVKVADYPVPCNPATGVGCR